MLGNKVYSIKYALAVTQEDIPGLPKTMRLRIQKAIEERLTTDPARLGKALRHSLKGRYRLRVGDYRILYFIDQSSNTVLIVGIRHRREAYDDHE